MFANSSSPSPGGRFPQDPVGYHSHSAARPRHDNPGQERGLRRGNPVYRRASPSPSRHRHRSPRASPSPSRRPSKPHRQHSRDHQVHSRSRPIAMPDYRHHAKSGNSSRAHHQPEYASSRRSEDSVSSSVSSSGSLFDRRGAVSGYSSSRTSLEDDAEPSKRGRSPAGVRTIREKQNRGCGDSDHLGDATVSNLPEDGNSVWSRVATAASTLTVSVSKAWAANVTTNSGEDTPPGEESRLLRAMKAYHLDKARDPSDLPSWLFSEQDRRPVGQLRLASRHDYTDGTSSAQPTPLSPRGLRDIYDTAASVTSPTSPRSDAPTSKAASHLKALRDAKRNVLIPNVTSPREEKSVEVEEDRHRKRAQRRMGMPLPVKHGRF